jgi:type III pantothenate kinase
MLLLIDAGNTRIKWALMAADALGRAALGHWSGYGSLRREDIGQLTDIWRAANISRVLLSNVAGEGMRDALEPMLLRAAGLKPVPVEWFRSMPELAGVRNAYRNPAQLGCDRFAAAIGAHALVPNQTLLVVTCGTATTVDAVTADGVFLGGMILPGLGLMAAALAGNTAQLPQITPPTDAPVLFADNTDDAIAAGCLAAQTGAIERAAAQLAQRYGAVRCIISGGAAMLIAPQLSIPCDRIDDLVLIGLQVVAMKQSAS